MGIKIRTHIKIYYCMILILVFAISILGFKVHNTFSIKNTSTSYIENAVNESLKLITSNIEFEEIITTKDIFWLGDSVAAVKVKGRITAGSELIEVKMETNKIIFTLSEPVVSPEDINLEKIEDWKTHEKIFNKFDKDTESRVFQENRIGIANELQKEVQQMCKSKNEEIISSIVNNYGNGLMYEIDYIQNKKSDDKN